MDDTASNIDKGSAPPRMAAKRRRAPRPDWADGLKRFYDSVVDEPLPDDLASLLARLDEVGEAEAAGAAGNEDRA